MMRFVIQVAALALLAAPALAQNDTTPAPASPPAAAPAPAATPAPQATAPSTTAPTAAAPATPAAPKKYVGHHISLKQRFAAANVAHDGHLTKDEATAAKWSYVTKHFEAMDTANKGYVTQDDISAYSRAQHAAHHKPATPPATPAPATPPATNG